MPVGAELQEYGTTDGIKFLADPWAIATGQLAYVPLSGDEFSRIYDNPSRPEANPLSHAVLKKRALLKTLSERFPGEEWNGFGQIEWTVRKSGESEDSYVVEEKNLLLHMPRVYTTKNLATMHSAMAQGICKRGTIRMPSKDYPRKLNHVNYITPHPEKSFAFWDGGAKDAEGGKLKMYGEISLDGYNRILYQILKPNDYISCASGKDFYIFGKRDEMSGYNTGINVLPALPSKMEKVLGIIKSAWDGESFGKLEKDIGTIDILEERGHKKQADELKAELEEKVSSIRKNVGI